MADHAPHATAAAGAGTHLTALPAAPPDQKEQEQALEAGRVLFAAPCRFVLVLVFIKLTATVSSCIKDGPNKGLSHETAAPL